MGEPGHRWSGCTDAPDAMGAQEVFAEWPLNDLWRGVRRERSSIHRLFLGNVWLSVVAVGMGLFWLHVHLCPILDQVTSVGGLKLAKVEVFTPWKSANTNTGASSEGPRGPSC